MPDALTPEQREAARTMGRAAPPLDPGAVEEVAAILSRIHESARARRVRERVEQVTGVAS